MYGYLCTDTYEKLYIQESVLYRMDDDLKQKLYATIHYS